MSKIIRDVRGSAMPFAEDDVDTDVFIPSKFLLTITWEDVGKGLLFPRRYDKAGELVKESPLNDAKYSGARVLLAGKNFGCGSSREHAPQAIKANYDAVVATSYAGIFDGNCYAIGLPAVKVGSEVMETLLSQTRNNPNTIFRMDLDAKIISFNGGFSADKVYPFELDDIKRNGFLSGTWDERDLLVSNLPRTKEVANALPYVVGF